MGNRGPEAKSAFLSASGSISGYPADYDDFESAFYYGLLLQPKGLAAIDTFFIGPKFLRLASETGWSESWFQWGYRNKLIVPHKRSDVSFSELCSKLEGQGFLGADPKRAKWLAECLDGERIEPKYWRSDLISGEGFEKKCRRVFSLNLPHEHDVESEEEKRFLRFWQDVEEYRQNKFWDEVRKRTESFDQKGIRVSDIVAVFRERELGGESPLDDNFESLCQDLSNARKLSKQKTDNVARFFRRIVDLYNVNMADFLDTNPNLTVTDPDFVVMERLRLGCVKSSTTMPASEAPETRIEFEQDCLLPSLQQLKNQDAAFLEKAAEFAHRCGYVDAYTTWAREQLPENAGRLCESLLSYASHLVKAVGQSNVSTVRIMGFRSPSDNASVTAIVSGGVVSLALVLSGVGIVEPILFGTVAGVGGFYVGKSLAIGVPVSVTVKGTPSGNVTVLPNPQTNLLSARHPLYE